MIWPDLPPPLGYFRVFEVKMKPKMVERALLVGVCLSPNEEEHTGRLLKELEELVDTLGVPVVASQVIRVRQFNAKLLVGKGKAEELSRILQEKNMDCLVFDNELTPAQQRNLEKMTGVCVIDREEVILDIFGQRAQTKEARLQVDLARMTYSLPRLTRAWSHLGQQGGGIGTRGEGETQLEQDRRIIRKQIDRLKKELDDVRRRRQTQRAKRVRVPVPHAAIVGYTNAGKSSLLKLLTGADVLVENQLFATLDTTTRKIELPNKQRLLLTDTVGFVRKLPHLLVEAFKATLEEALTADFLLHVIDATDPDIFEMHQTTMDVLKELKADEKETIMVMNKMDLMKDTAQEHALRLHFPDACFVSIQNGTGIPHLIDVLTDRMSRTSSIMDLAIPHHRTDLVALLHREAHILSTDYSADSILLTASIPHRIRTTFQAFSTDIDETPIPVNFLPEANTPASPQKF